MAEGCRSLASRSSYTKPERPHLTPPPGASADKEAEVLLDIPPHQEATTLTTSHGPESERTTSQDILAHNGPGRLTKLEELRKWYTCAKEAEEIRSLRLIKARYKAGDNSMFSSPRVPKSRALLLLLSSA
jgi:hypothetical protein